MKASLMDVETITAVLAVAPPGNVSNVQITPAQEEQHIRAPAGYYGFAEVTVSPIPKNYGKISYNGYALKVE